MFHIQISICLEKNTIYICEVENEMTLKLSENIFHGNFDIMFSGHILWESTHDALHLCLLCSVLPE